MTRWLSAIFKQPEVQSNYGKAQQMKIFIGSKDDIKAIIPLTYELQQLHIANEPSIFKRFSKRKVTAFFEKHIEMGRATLLVAREGDKIAGYAFIVEHLAHEGTFVHQRRFIVLEQIVVAPDFQKKGLGRELTLRAKQIALQKGFQDLELGVWEFNAAAQRLFASCGFSPMLINMRTAL